ncbi:MAG: metallophosphoesterase family protein [Thermoleophilaceae bacterium]|nr:metallophosphoesterase family protein [Thermoleophilaceae bacterium]
MIALLYDIHGNDHALEAVIADATDAGTDAWLLGGDYCLMGAQPAAVLDRLEGLPADTIWLRGNTERWVAHPEADDIPIESIRDAALFVQGAIGPDSVKELAALPDVLGDVPFDGAENTVFCHASPDSDMLGFTDQPADTDAEAATSKFEANTIVCGHTHIQFAREVGVVEVVNPGSVGLPFDGDRRAAYALLAPDGSFELRRVDYDFEAALDAAGELEGAWAELARTRLLNAQY